LKGDFLDYHEALNRILQLVDFERLYTAPGVPVRHDLERIGALLVQLGEPHLRRPTVHIAGTKGKGSVAAMCTSILASQGHVTGLYTSPHLHTIRERIRLNGIPVSEDEFASLVEAVWPAMEAVSRQEEHSRVTLFEYLTAMAFMHFKRAKAAFQVVEVGLGGRLDATNVVSPQVCAVTSLSLDHTAILGDTLEQIAFEKAGIIKAGSVVVCAPQKPQALEVVRKVCQEREARLIEVGREMAWSRGDFTLEGQKFKVEGRLGSYQVWTPLLGEHQLENAATTVGIMEALTEQGYPISYEAIQRGLEKVSWPCWMEVLGRTPLVIADGAHNPHSAAKLRDSLGEYFTYRRIILLIGVSHDKNIEGIVEELAQLSPKVITTRSRHPRAAPTTELAHAFASHGTQAIEVESTDKALAAALEMAHEEDLVLATGSLFLAAEVREAIKGIAPELYWRPVTPSAPTTP
jgi:dihydrofolate synthase/folylpolyglutamate synthase